MHSSIANKVSIADICFDNVTMQGAVARIEQMVQHPQRPQYVCTANLDHLFMLEKDAAFRAIYKRADLILADGMPVVWLSHLCPEGRLQERVAGSDLFWELARTSSEKGLRLFFLGGAPGSALRATEAVQRRHPGAQVCGTYCPSFEEFDTEAEQARIEAAIRDAAPDVLLVGLGAPKQEKWIAAHMDRLGVPVSIGVGGSFEMAGGIVRRAPQWMQRTGTEWMFRMMQDPKRLWRRYILGDLPFLVKLTTRTLASAVKTRAIARQRREAYNREELVPQTTTVSTSVGSTGSAAN